MAKRKIAKALGLDKAIAKSESNTVTVDFKKTDDDNYIVTKSWYEKSGKDDFGRRKEEVNVFKKKPEIIIKGEKL